MPYLVGSVDEEERMRIIAAGYEICTLEALEFLQSPFNQSKIAVWLPNGDVEDFLLPKARVVPAGSQDYVLEHCILDEDGQWRWAILERGTAQDMFDLFGKLYDGSDSVYEDWKILPARLAEEA